MLPADLVLMLKAFITLEGMGRSLDPDFDMASEAAPGDRAGVLKSHYSPTSMARRLQKSLVDTVRVVGGLPDDLSRLLRAARRGRIEVHVDINSSKEVSAIAWTRPPVALTLGIVTAALIIGSAIAMNVDPSDRGVPILGMLGFIGAAAGWHLAAVLDLAQRA
jgi:ubiquinone biosynthesis protein